MSELHRFIFDGLPVRGMVVRLTDAWQEILRRHAGPTGTGAYPQPVRELLGEMAAAGVLMQGNIKFNGALVLQIFGDGPVKVAVAEVQPDLSLRATATVVGEVPDAARLSQMVNVGNLGRCAITLDPKDRLPGQQAYQGVVPLFGDRREPLERLSEVLEHYMLQSEQLDTALVLAADDQVAAGLLIQRLPVQGQNNLAGQSELVSELGTEGEKDADNRAGAGPSHEDGIGLDEHYNRIAILARSLKREELLSLDVDTILRRLFWEEPLRQFAPLSGQSGPRFACSCSRERVRRMIRSLGQAEVEALLAERGQVEVGCDFCGQLYHFDPVDAAQIFAAPGDQPPVEPQVH